MLVLESIVTPMDKITSLQNPHIKELAQLRSEKGLFLVEGFHLVEMALQAGAALEILSLEPYKAAISVTMVTPEIIKKLSSTKTPEGIIALCRLPKALPLESSRCLLLDGIQDPGNVGTLLRTALSFGFQKVYLSKGCASPLNSKTLLASQGALFKLSLFSDSDLLAEMKVLSSAGFSLVSTDLSSSTTLSSVAKKDKIALILGNEARGVSSEVQHASDVRVRLEMSGIDSLNVAVAGGILMYELRA